MVRPTALPVVLALLVACEPAADDTDLDTDTEVGTSAPLQDADLDGIEDDEDNCPADENTDQLDSDSDGAGDVCDPCPNDALDDADGDGVCGDLDGCPELDDDQTDSDGDGIGDACDVCTFDPNNDLDDDDVCGDIDICPEVPDADQIDSDGDGFGDACACDEGSYRDYTDASCAICPAAGLDTSVVDFDNPATRYDPATNTMHFALVDDVQIVSATATLTAISFDEYGYDAEELQDTLTGTVSARIVSFALDDMVNIDPFADGIDSVQLTLVDACGDSVVLDNLVIEASANGSDLTVDPFRYQECGELDLASATGSAIASGTTEGGGRDVAAPSALDTASPDVTFTWTAPSTGTFRIDTAGSDFDTVLWVLADDCSGEPLAVNDDGEGLGVQSRVFFDATQGQTIVVVIAGYSTDTGSYVLNIIENIDT